MAIPGLPGGFIMCQGHLVALKGHLCSLGAAVFVAQAPLTAGSLGNKWHFP